MPTRTFLPLALLVALILTACGGGGASNNNVPPVQQPPPQSPYLSVSGVIEVPTGGSISDIEVVALGQETRPNAQGVYSAEVHSDGLSLVLAAPNGRSFSLARIFVAGGEMDPSAVDIDAESTAVSLVFISPYIFTSDPDEAAIRLTLIQSDPTIAAFAEAIDEAWNQANPFQNAPLQDAWQTTLASVANTIGPISQSFANASKPVSNPGVAALRLPKRSTKQQNVAFAEAQDPKIIDADITTIDIIPLGDQYLLQPDSEFNNASDWWVEAAAVDHSQFQFNSDLDNALADPEFVYARVGPADEPVGIDVNRAKGVLRFLEPVDFALDWIAEQQLNLGSSDGIAVPADQDAIYIVRSFSGNFLLNERERVFVTTQVPNGAANESRARAVNYMSTAFDFLGIALDVIPYLDDSAIEACFKEGTIDAFLEVMQNPPPEPTSVNDAIELATEIGQDYSSAWAQCLVTEGVISTAVATSWLSDAWGTLLGWGNIAVTLAQNAERYSFMAFTATPLESLIVIVGSPLEGDSEAPTVPGDVTATPISMSDVRVEWSEAADNDLDGVAEYLVYRDSVEVGSSMALSFVDRNLAPNTSYCYQVQAYDFAGNPSPLSAEACATTHAAGATVTMESIVNPSIPIPGTDESFSYIGEAVIDDGRVLFQGGVVNYSFDGLFVLGPDGQLSTIRGFNEGNTESKIRLDGDLVYYAVGNTYYLRGQDQVQIVVDGNDAPPRPGPSAEIGSVKEVIAENGNLAFITSNGVFADVGGTRYWVAESSMIPPGASNTFWSTAFSGLGFDGTRLAFRGYSSSTTGLYDWSGTALAAIDSGQGATDFDFAVVAGSRTVFEYYDLNSDYEIRQCDDLGCTALLDGSGSNEYGIRPSLQSLFVSGDTLAFHQHISSSSQGIYVLQEGELIEVLHISDSLDGQEISSFELVGFDGDTLLIIVRWTPGYSDLYRAVLSFD